MAFNGYTIDHVTLAALDPFEANCVALKTCSRKGTRPLRGRQARSAATRSVSGNPRSSLSAPAPPGWGRTSMSRTRTSCWTIRSVSTSRCRAPSAVDPQLQDQVLKPAAIRLANEVDKIVLRDVAQATYLNVGTYGTTPTAMSTVSRRQTAAPLRHDGASWSGAAASEREPRHGVHDHQRGGHVPQSHLEDRGSVHERGSGRGVSGRDDLAHGPEPVRAHQRGESRMLAMNGTTASGATSIVTDGWTGSGAVAR